MKLPRVRELEDRQKVQARAYRAQKAIERNDAEVVGVNVHRVDDEPIPETLTIDADLEARQVARTQALRSERDSAVAQGALDAISRAAEGSDNLLPHILHAVKSEATLGEIADALRKVFGVHKEVVVL